MISLMINFLFLVYSFAGFSIAQDSYTCWAKLSLGEPDKYISVKSNQTAASIFIAKQNMIKSFRGSNSLELVYCEIDKKIVPKNRM